MKIEEVQKSNLKESEWYESGPFSKTLQKVSWIRKNGFFANVDWDRTFNWINKKMVECDERIWNYEAI